MLPLSTIFFIRFWYFSDIVVFYFHSISYNVLVNSGGGESRVPRNTYRHIISSCKRKPNQE